MDAIGKRYGRLPSELVGITNTWTAYQFNRAVLIAGLDHEVEAYEKQKQNAPTSNKGGKRPSDGVRRADGTFTRDKSAYAHPSELLFLTGGRPIPKMKIPENGIW